MSFEEGYIISERYKLKRKLGQGSFEMCGWRIIFLLISMLLLNFMMHMMIKE